MSKYIAEIEFEGEKNCKECPLTRYGLLSYSVNCPLQKHINFDEEKSLENCPLKSISDSVTDTEGKPYKNVWDYLNKHWVFSQKEKPISSYAEVIYELLKRNNSNYEYAFHDMLTLFQDYVHIPDSVTTCTDGPTVTIPANPINPQEPVIISSPIAGVPEPSHADIIAAIAALQESMRKLQQGERIGL